MAALENRTLIDALIEEQQALSAVERFAREHDHLASPAARYRELLPATPLEPGEQFAFEVDLDKCSGCKACVTACHSLNGLDDDETWREVGLLIEAPKPRRNRVGVEVTRLTLDQRLLTSSPTSLQHVTTACHHCVDPACLNGCPVLAYDKDTITGIVRHLDDQCIGCQYCVLKCPYDVPKYNSRLGIVRKCDMCSNRLAVGEAPACAQACPNEAIRITKVQTETVTIEFRERATTFLAGAPEGDYTLPTTQYIGRARRSARAAPSDENPLLNSTAAAARAERRALPELVSADHAELKPQPAHWPLVLMLVLTQASFGAALASLFFESTARQKLLALSLGLAISGLAASVFHLGRPLGAWRGFLNVRRSWMSREIVVFGVYPALLVASFLFPKLALAAAAVGAIGVFCSAMIYADTRRELWRASRTVPLFFNTAFILGTAGALVLLPTNVWFVAALAVLVSVKLALGILVARRITDRVLTPMRKTGMMICGTFQFVALAHGAVLLLGGLAVPLLVSMNALRMWCSGIAFALLLLGEICERYLFFRCVVAPKMPGGLPT